MTRKSWQNLMISTVIWLLIGHVLSDLCHMRMTESRNGYMEYNSSVGNCDWKLPKFLGSNYAMALHIVNISIPVVSYTDNDGVNRRACSGYFTLPTSPRGVSTFVCQPDYRCYIYIPKTESCEISKALRVFSKTHTDCEHGKWITVDELPRTFSFKNNVVHEKYLRVEFQYISCEVNKAMTTSPTTTTVISTFEAQASNNNESLTAVVILLCLLLILALVVILWMQKRYRRLFVSLYSISKNQHEVQSSEKGSDRKLYVMAGESPPVDTFQPYAVIGQISVKEHVTDESPPGDTFEPYAVVGQISARERMAGESPPSDTFEPYAVVGQISAKTTGNVQEPTTTADVYAVVNKKGKQ